MMMKMLEAGGMAALTDEIRAADKDNPKGYYEFERVKKLDEGDIGWVKNARGKAVKIISALLKHLPADHTYKVIFMQRRMDEVLASQKQMLIRRGEPADAVSDEKMMALFDKHLQEIHAWLSERPNVQALYVSYNEILESPAEYVEQINQFLDYRLDAGKMIEVVDEALYRQRK
jgi:argonaute-like protein implicated in RNA metabolism and viral defense